jgi:glucose/arabinose dehydrogenase
MILLNRLPVLKELTRALLLLTLIGATETTSAFPSYLNTWSRNYPGSTSAAGVSCALCHTGAGGGNGWNFYGWEIRQQRFDNGLAIGAALLAVENFDSDGNGDSNLAEINANTQPGWTVGNANTSFLKNGSTNLNLPPPSQGTPDPTNRFQTWITGFNLAGDDALRSADPDHDGFSNDDEHRFGGIPTDPASFPSPQANPNDGNAPSFTTDLRIDDDDLIFIPRWSRTLDRFNRTNFTTTSDAASPFGAAYVRRTFNTDLAGEPTLFFRIDSVDQVLTVNPYDQRVTLELQPVVTNALISPVDLTHAGDGSNRLFIAEQRGTIRILDANGSLLPTPFLDIESKLVTENQFYDERGLLGLAFHPDYATPDAPGEGRFYLYYSAPSPNAPGTTSAPVDHLSVLAEYRVSPDNPNVADLNSERILLTLDQPQFNHNGGGLAFGPDGTLYVSIGDGGGQNDNGAGHTGGNDSQPAGALGNAQDLTNLFGTILRLDVLGTNGPGGQYGIPADNPFAGSPEARGEIYAYGLRNSWRFSFDDGPGGTNRLFAADVGQNDVEEIDLIVSGGNYGWRRKEGSFVLDGQVEVDPATLIDPIAEYAHPDTLVGLPRIGRSITGGFVYRGSAIPQLNGFYVFGDWSSDFSNPSGTIMALEEVAPDDFALFLLDFADGNPLNQFLPTFGEDESGELYVATKTILAVGTGEAPTGSIYKIVPAGPCASSAEGISIPAPSSGEPCLPVCL